MFFLPEQPWAERMILICRERGSRNFLRLWFEVRLYFGWFLFLNIYFHTFLLYLVISGITLSSLVVSNAGLKNHQVYRHTKQLHPTSYSPLKTGIHAVVQRQWMQQRMNHTCAEKKLGSTCSFLGIFKILASPPLISQARPAVFFLTLKKPIVRFCNSLLINFALPAEKKTLPQRDTHLGLVHTCLFLSVLLLI